MRRKGPEDPTRLRLASERSEAEIAAERRRSDAERAAEALNDAVRELAANLLRIIAGAGKQHALIDEAIAFLKAYRELQPYPGSAAYPYSPIAPRGEGLTDLDWRKKNPAYWPASGFVDTEKRCLLKLEVVHGKAGICAGVQG
jgi:hypothetical protein